MRGGFPHPSLAVERGSMAKERILFVDDEEALVEIVKLMLKQEAYEVVTRMSSAEALELFRTAPDDFDLVMTDMKMPKMTGERLAEKMMSIRPDIPIIICTGFSELVDEERARAIGIKAFVTKPYDVKKLSAIIRKVLDENPSS